MSLRALGVFWYVWGAGSSKVDHFPSIAWLHHLLMWASCCFSLDCDDWFHVFQSTTARKFLPFLLKSSPPSCSPRHHPPASFTSAHIPLKEMKRMHRPTLILFSVTVLVLTLGIWQVTARSAGPDRRFISHPEDSPSDRYVPLLRCIIDFFCWSDY